MENIYYQIGRIFGTPIFKHRFHPTIVGSENIPKDGPILLCGNHLHVLDQFPVIISTKRTTHWMAKKEYFDSNLGFLFKLTGAICVDRNGDAKKAENEALSYLNTGSAVGIFPEGTRNCLKEGDFQKLYNYYKSEMTYDEFKNTIGKKSLLSQIEFLTDLYNKKNIDFQDYKDAILDPNHNILLLKEKGIITQEEYDDSLLLPFKFGAVSMAKKTNAKLVPFAVTGDYSKGDNDLIVEFGEAFDVVDKPIEDANVSLREKVKQLIKK